MVSVHALLLGVCCLLACSVRAGDTVFFDSFEEPPIEPVFPQVGGSFQLPPGPAVDQLQWVLSELASGETTTAQEISDHFVAGVTNPSFFNDTLRQQFPDAQITDVVLVSPISLTVVIESPGGSLPQGFVNLRAGFTDPLIQGFSVFDFFSTVQFAEDQNLTLEQAADKFATLAQQTSLLVARLNASQCVPILDRNAATLRGTGSIFKIWPLGGAAQAVFDGTISNDDLVPLVASELALGGFINDEPLGTQFTLDQLATLMIGISDNTATDLLHEYAGRTIINQFVDQSGVADPNVLKPLLSINEQFHLFFSFALATFQSYVDGTEMFQQDFLDNQIVPLGPQTSQPFFNDALFAEGSWQASPLDICNALAKLRRTPRRNDAFGLVNRAMSAGVAQPGVRNAFDRTWYKGGSLEDLQGFRVLTHAWLLESNDGGAYVVVAMANNPAPGDVDLFIVQSLTSRIIELVAEGL